MAITIQTIAAIAVAVVSTAHVSGQSTRDNVTPDLTGAWVLNAELSDKPGQMRGPNDAGGRGPSGRPGGRVGGGGGMGGRGRGGFGDQDGRSREEMERMRAVMEAATRMPTRLTIVKADTRLVVTDEEGVSYRIPLDGEKETGAANGAPFETTAKWEDGTLRVERKFKGGLKLVEQYALSVDPRTLTVSSKIEGGRMPGRARAVKRVYDSKAS